jgi:hypothetical protein
VASPLQLAIHSHVNRAVALLSYRRDNTPDIIVVARTIESVGNLTRLWESQLYPFDLLFSLRELIHNRKESRVNLKTAFRSAVQLSARVTIQFFALPLCA